MLVGRLPMPSLFKAWGKFTRSVFVQRQRTATSQSKGVPKLIESPLRQATDPAGHRTRNYQPFLTAPARADRSKLGGGSLALSLKPTPCCANLVSLALILGEKGKSFARLCKIILHK